MSNRPEKMRIVKMATPYGVFGGMSHGLMLDRHVGFRTELPRIGERLDRLRRKEPRRAGM